ncbi:MULTISPECIES: histidine phosphatase family protein [Enterobacteriaceae]|uniref:histidine phosphatase family protein n=1 Tax=Enterobacteriaceae TaxID=543 RepID=UPI000272B31F|nr:histidine phosphatase family protein [Enterobacter sp. Ag1]EJF30706.1 phosphoglycerate mutase [Enterobacter sp. Ag1]
MRAILVRHGESEGNQQGIIQGRLESQLTARGLRQSFALAAELADLSVPHIYTSPALRAQGTANVLASELRSQTTVDERLQERDFGPLQGLNVIEAQKTHPELFNTLLSGEPHRVTPEGECLDNVSRRLFSCLNDLNERHRNDTVIIVTHGHALEIVLWQLKGALITDDLRQYGHQNCSYSIVDIEGECISLAKWGIATHLRDIR